MMTSREYKKKISQLLGGKKFIIAIQRESYQHVKTRHGVEIQRTAGGVHSLMDGILRETGGTMVALATGDADRMAVDEHNHVAVPPQNPSYTLRRVFIKKKEVEGFYYGFANQTLWPLCHVVFVKPLFNHSWWLDYVSVNQKFADTIIEELGEEDGVVWINDYHLALVPKMIRDKKPNTKIGVFWHIPWPTYEIFRICPWRKELFEGLLGADFIGFHRGYHVENFIDCVRPDLQILVDNEPKMITYKEHSTKLDNLPAGIDYETIIKSFEKRKPTKRIIRNDFGLDTKLLAIGVDRVDYTKGILERLKIIDRFLEKYPEYQGKLTYLSIGAPSRVHIPAYNSYGHQVIDLVEKINWKYGNDSWHPIVFVNETIPRERLFLYFYLSDVALVTSLDDGMNLVAKEYVICNQSERGMLMLSKFTGAAKDLHSAILINPYDTEGSVNALLEALTMEPKEKKRRNEEMKSRLAENNIYQWGVQFIEHTIS